MRSGFLDRHRAQRFLAEQGLDALVLTQPETVAYGSGAYPGVATFWRRAGGAFLVVPADPGAEPAAIVGDLQADAFKLQSGLADVRSHRIWVEAGEYNQATAGGKDAAHALVAADLARGKPERTSRPAQYDLAVALGLLREALADRGLLSARIGTELGFVAARDLPLFEQILPCVVWIDATRIVERLRAVKAPGEIARLRRAAELASAGLTRLTEAIGANMTAAEMTAIYRAAVQSEALKRDGPPPESIWSYISVGGDGFAPGGPAAVGDLVKIDVGCVVGGYSSDGGRTAVLGRASIAHRQVYDALRSAFEAGLAALAPGVALADVYRRVADRMWDLGFTTYGRGHFGHGL